MHERRPLQDETVIFTGTLKSNDSFERVKGYGGLPVSLPLIQVAELHEPTDELRLKACLTYEWLIFTSQNAVEAFGAKLQRYNMPAELLVSRIAAVGTRTAKALEKIGLVVDFIPSIFSADVFVKEFEANETISPRLLFLRGSMASGTIREELPFEVDEWTLYSTVQVTDSIDALVNLLHEKKQKTVLFASPSAVQAFAEKVLPHTGWNGFTVGAIGHVTENALIEKGATVHVRPDTYTLVDLVDKLAKRKEGLQWNS
ncbi:uroporphyrinogen-III synthase [Filibacter tadaridae]|uniref:Uroporphyrinogen-III synthase n=1 Tax=Filibacter tadaridae TaxID=2483811 RepID=A0A3P5XU41_9BACL|nr:uroporphyrinogen-III synthase [Filibacter tadaridae]VDC32655.1 uroporphyrinogen-III synthase [Filibacter tadaridae]